MMNIMIWWHYRITYSDGKAYEGFVEAGTAADAKDKLKIYYTIADDVSVTDIKILTSDEDDDYRDIVIELGEICR